MENFDDPWMVREEDFPWRGTAEDRFKFLLNYAVLAPSAHNTQPWLFRISGDELELYADRTRVLAVIDPEDRELVMSCGAALFNLRIAMIHYGFVPVTHTFPDLEEPDLLAFVHFGPEREASVEEHRLFMAIKKRRTNRRPFEPRPVPDEDLAAVAAAAEREGARLHVIRERADRERLADLIAAGDRMQASDPHFRRELASWIHPGRSHSRDGIPSRALGFAGPRAYAGPLVIRTFDWGRGQAARDRQLAEGSPALLVLSTRADTPPAWLTAGQALERALLRATDLGLCASFLNQPVEVKPLRAEVRELIGGERLPQLVLRMGYGAGVRPTPRRAVHEVLLRQRYH
ncbi:Acg family FMN-binding oxidoreductase [Rhodocaloribacter sp.]